MCEEGEVLFDPVRDATIAASRECAAQLLTQLGYEATFHDDYRGLVTDCEEDGVPAIYTNAPGPLVGFCVYEAQDYYRDNVNLLLAEGVKIPEGADLVAPHESHVPIRYKLDEARLDFRYWF